jgi:hypothetical protein
MAQYDFGTIDPNTKSGTALATDLNSYRNAVNSMHSGSSAPSYITAGMLWVDTTSANYELKLYDGAQSILVAVIDATNNVARVAVDPAETSYITSTTNAQIRHVIAGTNVFTTVSTGLQFNKSETVFSDSVSDQIMKFTTSNIVLVGKSAPSIDDAGIELRPDGQLFNTVTDNTCLTINRRTSDGTLISLRQGGTQEGRILVAGTSVTLEGAHLSRPAQFTDNSRPALLKGTVMSNLDQMSHWENEDNEQLNCVKVSDIEGDPNVAGVFLTWDDDAPEYNDIVLSMTGDMVIRIAAGTTVQRGDLLMSAGDGTAKPQGDDIVRAKTVAKVTSTHISHTYADGSYAVPCVLMAC